jgi:uncharacterized protein YggE
MNGSLLSGGRRFGGWIAIAAAGGLLVGLLAGPALASALVPARNGTVVPGAVDQPPEHTISVVGSGTVTVVPDMATIRLGVVIERQTAKAARNDAAAAMTRVVAAIRKLGIADRDIATSIVSLGPVYDYPSGSTPRIRGYQLQNIVTVTVRKLDVMSDVVDDAVAAGATSVDGITFDVADRAAAEKAAREAAVKDAKAKAQTLADGVGVRIAGVASMSEQVVTPVWYGRAYAAGEAKDASTPILAGSTDVVITVSVTFLIG